MRLYREKLKKFSPVGFAEKIEWQRVMSVWVVSDEIGKLRWRSGVGSFLRAIKSSFCDACRYETSERKNAKTMCFYGKYNYRADHYKTFSNFVENLDGVDWMKAVQCDSQWHILRGLKLSVLMCVWFVQALFVGMNPVQAANVAYPVSLCYMLKNDLEEIFEKRELKLFVTYYDASPDENFAVQIARIHGVATATLQHGIFAKKEPRKVLSDTAFEYSESISDYYLAWNRYTYDEWARMGLDTKRVRVLGIPKYIGQKVVESISQPKKSVFGIMLNNSSFKEHNIRLIQMGNSIAQRLGIKYVLRYHPELPATAYEEYIEKECFCGKSDNSLSIADYAKCVDFTIISSSSVFIDLIYLGHPVYRMIVHSSDTYASVSYNAFANVEELLETMQQKDGEELVFDYLCTTREIKKEYQQFIDSVVEDSANENTNIRL